MKKTVIILMSIFLFSIGCEKESIKSDKETLSELDLKVKELGIEDEYTLEAIINNPNNSFEAAGILHNYGCDIINEKMEKYNFKSGFDKEVICEIGYDLAKTMNMEIPNGFLKKIPFEKILSKNSFISDESLDQYVKEGLITENLKKCSIKLRESILQCFTLNEIQNKVILLENEFLTDDSLSELEKEIILSACAVARYSCAYWTSEGVIDTSSKGRGLMVVITDAFGFVIGGTTGGIFGGGVGAVIASALAAEATE
ncbi:MAG: hypothetical protein PWP52_751 [Bacteroidales bacterium]|nr:hypothetical protein [Bacteroidales bacterium]